MFPKRTWNVHTRVLDNRGRADCEIEAWHGVFGFGIGKHPTTNPLVKHLAIEQSRTNRLKARIKHKKEVKRRKQSVIDSDLVILELVEEFEAYKRRGELLDWLDLLVCQLREDTHTIMTSNALEVIETVASKTR
jgi:hypothetical protein